MRLLSRKLGDVIVRQRHCDLRGEITLEGEVDVARRHHQRAVDGLGFRKAHHQPARPMRQRAGLVGPAPHADGGRAFDIDVEIRARLRGHAHTFGRAQHFGRRADPLFERAVRPHPLQRFRRLFARDALVKHHTQRIDIGPGPLRIALHILFNCGIGRRIEGHLGAGGVSGLEAR